MNIGPDEPDQWDAMAGPMAAMFQILQDRFGVSTQSIAVVAATVLARKHGPDTLKALELGVEIGLEDTVIQTYEPVRRKRQSKLETDSHDTNTRPS